MEKMVNDELKKKDSEENNDVNLLKLGKTRRQKGNEASFLNPRARSGYY